MILNRLPGKGHVLMQKAGSDGGLSLGCDVKGLVDNTQINVSEICGIRLLDKSILEGVGLDVNFPQNDFYTIFSSDSVVEPNEMSQYLLSLEKKYIEGGSIQESDFQTLIKSPIGIDIIDEFCRFYEDNLSSGEYSLESVETSFICFLMSGFQKDFETIFVKNMLFDIEKIKKIFQNLLFQSNNTTSSESKNLYLGLIIIFCNVINQICAKSQLDSERKSQIQFFLDIMSENILVIVNDNKLEKDSGVIKSVGNLVYIYHRNIVHHSYTGYIETRDKSKTHILNAFKERVSENISSANEILIGSGKKMHPSILYSIGNISYLLGVLMSKMEEHKMTSDERDIFNELVTQYKSFLFRVLEGIFGQNVSHLVDFGKISFADVRQKIILVNRLIYKISQSQSIILPENHLLNQENDVLFINRCLHNIKAQTNKHDNGSKKQTESMYFELINNHIMFSDSLTVQDLGIILQKLLEHKNDDIDSQGLLLKNIDEVLKKLSEKKGLTLEHLNRVENYILSSGKNSKLLVMYSRVYLTLAYFYAENISSKEAQAFFLNPKSQEAKRYFSNLDEKVKKYLYKFTIIKSIEKDLESYLDKYGLNIDNFLLNIEKIQTGLDNDIVMLDDGEKSDIILNYISDYGIKYYIDLTYEFLDTLVEMRKSKFKNINLILDFIRNNLFYGLCDIYESGYEIKLEKGELIEPVYSADGKVILNLVYREQFKEIFYKLFLLSQRSLKSMVSQAIHELELSEDEQKNLTILSEAIEENRLKGFYHPIIDSDGNIVYYELLMRITGPDQKVLYPNPVPFLNVGRKKGMIPEITHVMIQQIIKDLEVYPDIKVSINMDANDLLDDRFFNEIKHIFTNNPKLYKHISFEILESHWPGNHKMIFEKLEELTQSHNIEFALDDFGTGEASTAKLITLMKKQIIKKIKIDGELVQSLFPNGEIVDGNPDTERIKSILRGIFEAAHGDNIKIVCEYIEKGSWLEKIRDTFSDFTIYYQGWGAGGRDSEKPVQTSVYSQNKK